MNKASLTIKSFELLLPICFVASCTWSKPAPPAEPVQVVSNDTLRVYKDALENIKTANVKNSPFPELLSLMGKISITEDRTTIIPARVAGRIESIYFASGEHVNKGQILATLFSPDFISAKEEYLQSIKQQARSSEGEKSASGYSADPSDFANLAQMSKKKLLTMGLTPQDIAEIGKSTGDDNDKSLLTIRAPRSGVLIQKSAALGNLVNVGDNLFIVGDLDKVWFSGDIYPEDLPKVHKDQEVFINAVGVNKALSGKVSFISPLVDPNTRSIKIRAMMDNPKQALKSDEYVQGNVVLQNKTALIIPTEAVVRTPEGYVVYEKVKSSAADNKETSVDFKRIAVTPGSEQGGLTAISSGLNAGDEVVTDGSWLLDAALNSAKNSSSNH